MLTFGADAAKPDAKLIESRVAAAVGRRANFFADAYTNAVRLVNAESDLMPGVVADYYAGHVVCQFTSAGADVRKGEIADALMKFAPGCIGVSERRDADSRAKEGLPTSPAFASLAGEEPPEFVEIALDAYVADKAVGVQLRLMERELFDNYALFEQGQ